MDCLKQWQKSVLLTQSTHPKYQTNIDKVCTICSTLFNIKSKSRHQSIVEYTGQEIIKLIQNGYLSQGHAKILVGLDNSYLLAKKIIDKKLSVRQTENLVKLLKHTKKINLISKDVNLKNLEVSLQNKLGIRVTINNKKNNTGKISFEYKNLDQLNRLIDVIKNNY